MIIIIDGTGPWFDDNYEMAMGNSFCSTLAKSVGIGGSYLRGPSASGYEVSGSIDAAVDIARSTPDSEPLYLCGYSRGGHIAIRTAQIINPRPVKAMFLFDAVQRSISGDSSRISGNVRKAYHAIRDQLATKSAAEKSRKALMVANQNYDNSRNKLYSAFFGPDPKLTSPLQEQINAHAKDRNAIYDSRNETGLSISNFGNTGLNADAPTDLLKKEFKGSHGALGGVPWPESMIEGDRAASLEVRAWMWANFTMEGVLNLVAQGDRQSAMGTRRA